MPLGRLAALKGHWGEDGLRMVGLGAGVVVDMTEAEYQRHVASRHGHGEEVTPGGREDGPTQGPDGEPVEIMEELTDEDHRILDNRGKPRIAHTPCLQPRATSTPADQLAAGLDRLRMVAEEETTPLKSKVVERIPLATTTDPLGRSAMGAPTKASLFKQKLAQTPASRDDETS